MMLYIHCIFLDYHALSEIIRAHMNTIRVKIVEPELDRFLELLLWLLFKDERNTNSRIPLEPGEWSA